MQFVSVEDLTLMYTPNMKKKRIQSIQYNVLNTEC